MLSDDEPIAGGGERFLRSLILAAKDRPETTIKDGGHFLQEEKDEEMSPARSGLYSQNGAGLVLQLSYPVFPAFQQERLLEPRGCYGCPSLLDERADLRYAWLTQSQTLQHVFWRPGPWPLSSIVPLQK